MGCEHYDFVRTGNLLASRVFLTLWLAAAVDVRFLLEQPGGSILGEYAPISGAGSTRFRALVSSVSFVSSTTQFCYRLP